MIIKEPFKPDNLFFTSDSHFGHHNIIEYCQRNLKLFFDDVDEMNSVLIKRWNDIVPKDGIVFHLGDFFFMISAIEAVEILDQLNGTIYWVKGNHDRSKIYKACSYDKLPDRIEITVDDSELETPQLIVLDHFPLYTWNREHHGAWHLHGHCHGTFNHPNIKAIDVGVDSVHSSLFAPISYQQIKTIITHRSLSK